MLSINYSLIRDQVWPLVQKHCRCYEVQTVGLLAIRAGKHEQSIQNAYIDLINNSERFIYIENQFFVAKENKIVQALIDRINRAHSRGEKL